MPPDLKQLMETTWADHRLSTGERQALRAAVVARRPSDTELNQLRNHAFALVAASVTDVPTRQALAWLQDVLGVLQPTPASAPAFAAEACFSPDDDCAGRIIARLAACQSTLDICVFTITDDRLAEAIIKAHRRGVAVRIITDNDKAFDRGSDITEFESAGIAVRVDKTEFHMHHKFAIFDGKVLLSGSYNWTLGAARDNQENFILTADAALLAAFQREFEKLWSRLK
jgi:phosphatidylserine/phosphatidylglycerophosphate/cardiolipin synthase-like enzyme